MNECDDRIQLLSGWQFRPSFNKDLDRIYEVWHASVLAMHDFLDRSDLNDICIKVKND